MILAIPATAQTVVNNITFDCAGELTGVVLTEEGPLATGAVTLTVDLPNGAGGVSAGTILINLLSRAADANLAGRKTGRCIGEGTLSTEITDNINGVNNWSMRLDPIRVRVRIGNRRIQDPEAVGFTSTASGDPNV